MSDLTQEQFRTAVAAAISSVHHLYREVDRLIVGLREALAEEPNPLSAMRGMSSKGGRDPSRLIVRNEYGMLFGPSPDDEDDIEEEEDDDESDEEGDGEAKTARGKSKHPEIAPDDVVIGVRIGLYDPQKRDAFEPQVLYAVMQDWTAGGVQPSAGQGFVMQRRMLRLIPRALGTSVGLAKGTKVTTRAIVMKVPGARKAKDRRLACVLPFAVEAVPLYALDSAAALKSLGDQMKQMWANAIAGRE